jgi:signal transduction histidine kinase
MKRLKLRKRFVISFAALVLPMVVMLLLFFHYAFHRFMDDELRKRGVTIARHLAESSVAPILTENRVNLQGMVYDYVKNEKDIRYIYVVDHNRQVQAHSFGSSFPVDLIRTDEPLTGDESYSIKRLQSEEGRIDDITVSIQGGVLGRVHVGMSDKDINSKINWLMLKLIPLVLVILALGVLVWCAVASSITRPLADLARTATMLGSGDLDARAKSTSGDEINELALSFNHMADQLTVQQEELAELNRSLEERVKTALKEIRERDQLLIFQSRFAAMGEMINNIAHQWRQPLNNVGMLVQKIKQMGINGDLTQETLEQEVASAMKTIHFMSDTIDDFSNFFHRDKKRVRFRLNDVVESTVTFITPSLRDNKIKVEFEGEQVVEAEGFPNEYAQALLNIVCNAKDVLLEKRPDAPLISIHLTSNDGRSVVTVRDNGGGIAAEILPFIFDPYFSTKDQKQGAGIGLYMSKVIIEKNMNGHLTASNVGNGAEFRIEV